MRRLLALVVVLAALVLPAGAAHACSCALGSLDQQVARADSIGVGSVTWVAEKRGRFTFGVDFTDVYKGTLGSSEKVSAGAHGASCGWTPVRGARYALFLSGEHRGTITTGLCHGNERYDATRVAALEKVTGPPYQPVKVSERPADQREWFPAWVQWTAAGVAALVLVALGISVASRRR